ncbi:GntR family transcriptional regulator [Brevibacterium metallidurans]|uniref:GntR family transcriptional regulator n=1 Tax=Brevibacterium metallidurans TaxID=1482676 RepID=UPI0030DCF14E
METIEGGLARAAAKRAKGDGMPSEADPTVYARIKAMILDGTVPPGERITIDRIARELGVSQTPVREAMQRLEGDKLVRTRQPRGYATTPLLTKRDLEMMIEVRLLLEPWAARMAAVDRASNPGRALLAELATFSGAAADGAAWKHELFRHDTRFHLLILEATGNSFLLDAYRQMHPHLHLFRLYPGDPHGTDTSHEHAEIAAAIAACDPDAAEAAMREHILRALSRFSASTSDGGGAERDDAGSRASGGADVSGAATDQAEAARDVRRDLADTYASVLGSVPGFPDAANITVAAEGRSGHDDEPAEGAAGAEDGGIASVATGTQEQAG